MFDGSAETDGRFVFFGSDGDDFFFGGAGDDRIIGLGGADLLTGGGGSDIFVYSGAQRIRRGADYDTIADFDPARGPDQSARRGRRLRHAAIEGGIALPSPPSTTISPPRSALSAPPRRSGSRPTPATLPARSS